MEHTKPSDTTLKRFFKAGFKAGDVAEALVSFDDERTTESMIHFMELRDFDALGVRKDGLVAGFVERADLGDGRCSQYVKSFDEAMVMEDATPLNLVIPALDEMPRVFISSLGTVGGIITREDIEKPAARMWLFGLVTVIEAAFTRMIERSYPADSW